jgi:CubicO group peptidase (beta-lactamase class C family)
LPRTLERSFCMGIEAALEYSRKHGPRAFLVARGSDPLVEIYENGASADTAQPLYSGTKSFWGIAALRAQDENLISLDEPVAETVPAWSEDPWKRRVTLRMLLSLTAGFGFGGLGSSVPPYERALAMDLKNEPGSTFAYGGIQLQVFGAVFARKLTPLGLTPQQYLTQRVLAPAGVRIAAWRSLSDGTQPLPTGASVTAREWLAYARYVLRERANLAPCFEGSKANRRYGLGWWLGAAGAPEDLFYASGAGGQALYVAPSLDTIAVRFGKSNSYKHEAFLKRLFAG